VDEPNPAHLEAYFTAELPASGAPRRFGIVTAYNPESRPAPERENREADAALAARLKAEGRERFRVMAFARDGSHREPGFAIAAESPEDIRAFSRDFRQEAFFWVEDGIVYVINTDGVRRHLVARWEERLLPAPPADRPKGA
jgi:hypothetical protein